MNRHRVPFLLFILFDGYAKPSAMYIIATTLFILGIMAGGGFGYLYLHTALERLFAVLIGGFLGSSAGAILFIYTYFTSASYVHSDDENELEQIDWKTPDNDKALPAPPSPSPSITETTPPPTEKNLPKKSAGKIDLPKKRPWWLTANKKERQIRKLESELKKLKQKVDDS